MFMPGTTSESFHVEQRRVEHTGTPNGTPPGRRCADLPISDPVSREMTRGWKQQLVTVLSEFKAVSLMEFIDGSLNQLIHDSEACFITSTSFIHHDRCCFSPW